SVPVPRAEDSAASHGGSQATITAVSAVAAATAITISPIMRIASGRTRRMRMLSAARDAVAVQAPVQRLPRHAQFGRGLRQHAAGPLQRGLDRRAVGLVALRRRGSAMGWR